MALHSNGNADSKRPFRVIVVGAGIAGLTLSNALQRADIDHVVLEKHKQVVFPSGASIGMWPHGSRLLSQLGCLKGVRNACENMRVSYNRSDDGKAVVTSGLFDEIVKRHGYDFLLLERKEFIRCLYEGLPSQKYVQTGRGVKEVVHSANGVRVYLQDGTYEDGDIVVGCDGVSSPVRQMMWDHANKTVPGSISNKEMTSLKVRYKCLVGVSPALPKFPAGSMTVVHNDGFSFLLFTQPGMTFWFVFIALPKTHYWPNMPRYTQKDVDEVAAMVCPLPINESVTFKQIWDSRLRGDLINMEEGIMEHWHAGRIVIVGDAAHKMTPNIALGGLSAMESAAALANSLRAKLLSNPRPTQKELSEVFQAYQDRRSSRVKRVAWMSTMVTKVHACENWLLKMISLKGQPLISDNLLGAVFSDPIRHGVTLDYIPLVGEPVGTVQWVDDRVAKKGPNLAALVASLIMVLMLVWGVRVSLY